MVFCRSVKGGSAMHIHGLQKLTLLDYPGHTACTVFTGGCNYRCPFCHNASLVLHPTEQPLIAPEEVLSFLKKRQGLLDGVCITGGEPTLEKGLGDFCAAVKDLGFALKLDSNGSRPEVLRELIDKKLVDYIAMDIKSSRENYGALVGFPGYDTAPVEESAALLMEGRVDFEFRTTVVKEFHSAEDFERIGQWLRGGEKYFLQCFKDSGDILGSGCSAFGKDEMEHLREAVLPYIPNTHLRGVD